ncbi:hypothetical protein EDC02_7814 [Micromonospora sp. Llam0]|nr:hypothetical protein EDC02_7814 [Micromonospora sp. Llam0]
MATATVYVTDHSFGVFDTDEMPIEAVDWTTGLLGPLAAGAMIYTGVDRGPVHVSVDVRTEPPDEVVTDGWDDIVEATVNAPHGQLRVHSLEYGPTDRPPPLPILSPAGPGSYRIRVHARDRDLHYDLACTEPTERYLLTVWPAPPLPPLVIRATDRCGYGMRLSWLHRPTDASTLGPPPGPDPADELAHQRLMHARQQAHRPSRQ